ncbi:MAG: hypothetical protein J1F63_03465 [Oscillospiraceae bacterium]|nr:hypothetical protein [Oscillospiraceae bacterium]
MKKYINPPCLSTSFSESGKSVKQRVMNILDTRAKRIGIALLAAIPLTAVCAGACVSLGGIVQSEATTFVENGHDDIISDEEYFNELMAEYEKFGITGERGALYYNGELIRFFMDGYELENGNVSAYSDYNPAGTVDVHTVRDDILNPDGSTNLFGPIIEIAPYSREEFDARDFNRPKREAEATYDNSILEESPMDGTFDGNSGAYLSQETSEATTQYTGRDNGGQTVEEKLSQYKDYGLTYVKKNGSTGNIYFNGSLVSAFVDENPDGSIFVCQSAEAGSGTVHTVYDRGGKLAGLELHN